MMAKYQSIPQYVDAVQWHTLKDMPDVVLSRFGADAPGMTCLWCAVELTKHGVLGGSRVYDWQGSSRVCPGDWVITHANGDRERCTDTQFTSRYQACAPSVDADGSLLLSGDQMLNVLGRAAKT